MVVGLKYKNYGDALLVDRGVELSLSVRACGVEIRLPPRRRLGIDCLAAIMRESK
jgi:hypothetical protein